MKLLIEKGDVVGGTASGWLRRGEVVVVTAEGVEVKDETDGDIYFIPCSAINVSNTLRDMYRDKKLRAVTHI